MEKLKMILLSLVLAVCLAGNAQAQLRPETLALASRIERVSLTNQPRHSPGGYHLGDSLAVLLKNTATAAELLELTRHPKPAARTTALLALLESPGRDSLELHRLMPEHFHDTATVRLHFFDQIKYHKDQKVGEVFLNALGGFWFAELWLHGKYSLKKPQKEWLDSVFICTNTAFNPYKLGIVGNEKWKPKPSFYPQIRELVASGQDSFASVFLAHYRKEEDIPLILAHLPPQAHPSHGNRWQPFRYFQHPDLFAFLKNELPASWQNGGYIEAIAIYKNDEAAALLDSVYVRIKSLEKKPGNNLYYLHNGILRNYSPAFASLYLRILTEFPESQHANIPDGLWETHADTLCQLYSVWKNGGRTAKDRTLQMMPKVIEHLQATDTAALHREIISCIKMGIELRTNADHMVDIGTTVKAYVHIYKTRNPAFIEPLFDILKNEPLGKNRFFIAKLLLRFDDPGMRERLTVFFRGNPSLAPTLKDAEEGGAFYSNFVHKAENP